MGRGGLAVFGATRVRIEMVPRRMGERYRIRDAWGMANGLEWKISGIFTRNKRMDKNRY